MESANTDRTAEAIIVFSDSGIIETCNPAVAALFHYVPEEVIGRDFRMLIKQPTFEGDNHFWKKILPKNDSLGNRHELSGLRKDGSTFAIELIVHKIDRVAEENLFIGIIRDLANTVQTYTEQQAGETPQEENWIVEKRTTSGHLMGNEILTAMGHDIRTHLSVIHGALGRLAASSLNQEQHGFVHTAYESSKMLLTVGSDLEDFCQLETGQLELKQDTFDLIQTVESTSELLAPQAYAKHIEIATFISPMVPRWLRADITHLRQILVKLTNNAIHFTHQGGVSITVSLTEEATGQTMLRFEVEDTGSIPDALRNRKIEAISLDNLLQRDFCDGIARSLYITRMMVQRMGGEMGFSTRNARSNLAWFTLPCDSAPVRSTHPILPSLKDLKVLIVAANPISRRVHEQQLQAWDIHVAAVDTGSAALAALHDAQQRGIPFSTVLIDQELTDCDGEELGSRILYTPDLLAPRLILMSGVRASSASERLRQRGFDALLTKPIRQISLYRWLCVANGLVDGGKLLTEAEEFHPTGGQTQGSRILLAEDSQVSQIVTVAMLEKAGYQVDAVDNGLEVLQALQAQVYDLVLLDVAMPDLDGFETAIQIRQLVGSQNRIPIIAITADDTTEVRDRCFAVGMNDYLTKPVDQVRMLSILGHWLSDTVPFPQGVADPVLDWHALQQLEADTDTNVLDRAISLFIEEARTRINHIAEARRMRDWQRLRKEAHALKSSAGTFGVRRLHQHAQQLDEACRQGDWDTALSLAETINSVAAPELEMLAYHYHHQH